MPPAAPSFPSCRKRRRRKGALVTIGAFCGYGSGRNRFFIVANTPSHLTGTILRAACHGTTNLKAAAFEWLRQIRSAFKICRAVRIRRSPVGADAGHSRSRRRSVTDVGLPLAGTHRPIGQLQIGRRFPEKPKRFFWSVQGGSGGKSKSPRVRFLFATFSFGEAKEKVGRQPQISNMRFVLLYVWLVVCVKGMRNLLSSLYYRDSLFVNYHNSLHLSSPLDRFGRM